MKRFARLVVIGVLLALSWAGGASSASSSTDWFADDNGHLFEADINALASAGITRGCNPPENTKFCPDALMTRGEMAAFLSRALNLPGG